MAVFGFAEAGAACELPPLPETAKPRATYRLDETKSVVGFDAKAFMHDFTGKTSKLRGTIRLGDMDRFTDAEACVTIDAAGFLDPFTGEGLYAGLRSAELAVRCSLLALCNGSAAHPIPAYDLTPLRLLPRLLTRARTFA